MYAIIRQGDGKYYTSVVFGYNRRRYIVLDEKKSKLVKQPLYEPNTQHINLLVLVTDENTSDWTITETKSGNRGALNFLPEAELLDMVERGEVPEELLRRCVELDARTPYEPYPEIRTEQDLKNLDWVSGDFHDAYIEKLETLPDGALYVLFDGTWGCKIEMWFEGDVAYETESRNPEKWDPYWQDSTILIRDGYIWLIDDADMTPEKLNDGYCWFRARRVKYHVIPD